MTLLNEATLAVMPARCPLSHSFSRGTGNTYHRTIIASGPAEARGLHGMSEGLGEKSNSDFSGQGVLLWNTVLLPSILLEKKNQLTCQHIWEAD